MASTGEINTITIFQSARSFFSFLLRRKLLIIITIALAGFLGAIYFWLKDPEYQADLTFALEESHNDVGGYANIAAQLSTIPRANQSTDLRSLLLLVNKDSPDTSSDHSFIDASFCGGRRLLPATHLILFIK